MDADRFDDVLRQWGSSRRPVLGADLGALLGLAGLGSVPATLPEFGSRKRELPLSYSLPAAGGRGLRAPPAPHPVVYAPRSLLPEILRDVSRNPSHYGSIGKQVLVNPSQPPEQHCTVFSHATPNPKQTACRQVHWVISALLMHWQFPVSQASGASGLQ